jgi:hypothetical protein
MICLAVFLLSTAAAQKPEPDAPSATETVAYIQLHSYPRTEIKLNGTKLEITRAWDFDDYKITTVDLMDLDAHKTHELKDQVFFSCKGTISCISYWGKGFNSILKSEDSYLYASDDRVAPHVSNALRHLIALVQKQHPAPPNKEPF